MRHRKLVFATFLALVVGLMATSTFAQGGKPAEGVIPDVAGRVTDLEGRSVRGAEITLFSVDSDEVVRVKTNAFGYYQVFGLTKGRTYLFNVSHRKYIFLIGSESVTVGTTDQPFDFLGESIR